MKSIAEQYAEIVAEKKLKYPHAYTMVGPATARCRCDSFIVQHFGSADLTSANASEGRDPLGECPMAELAFLRTTTAGDLAASCETNAKLAREIDEQNARWNRHLNCVAAKDVQIKELNDRLSGAREGVKLWKERAQSGENVEVLNEQLRELKETVKLHETKAVERDELIAKYEREQDKIASVLASAMPGSKYATDFDLASAVVDELQVRRRHVCPEVSESAVHSSAVKAVGRALVYLGVEPQTNSYVYQMHTWLDQHEGAPKHVWPYPLGGAPKALTALAQRAFDNSKAHGFWGSDSALDDPRTIPAKLMLIVSEVSEALEEFRHDARLHVLVSTARFMNAEEPLTRESMTPGGMLNKLVGFASELADVLIRTFDLAGALGIDLDAAVSAKMKYNESRPFKHGKVI